MSQLAGDRVPRSTLTAAASTPPIELTLDDTAGQHRTISIQSLTHNQQTQLIKPAERLQIRTNEGSVRHVEVFRVGSVRTPIIERPRPSPRHRRAQTYTLNPEEPDDGGRDVHEAHRVWERAADRAAIREWRTALESGDLELGVEQLRGPEQQRELGLHVDVEHDVDVRHDAEQEVG